MPDWVLLLLVVMTALNLVGLVAFWVHLDRRTNDVNSLSSRVSKLETSVTYLPTHRELVEIRNAIGGLANELAAMRERSDTSTLMLRTIQEHLVETSR